MLKPLFVGRYVEVWCGVVTGFLASEKRKMQQLIKKVFCIPYELAKINSCLSDGKNYQGLVGLNLAN